MPLTYDPAAAVAHLRGADPVLARIIAAAGPLTLEPRDGSFRALARAIFFQQLAGPAARAIMNRVLAALGTDEQHIAPGQIISAADDGLRAAGLSRQKLVYLRNLAEKFASGELTEEEFDHLDDEEVIRRVSAVKGIGRWTAEMFLIFSLGRPDVLPVDDLGVRRGMQIAYGLTELPKPDEMGRIAAPWAPYRSAGTWYMWRSLGVALPEEGR
ncbi:MAG: DNA-3-methyladenine glycosylase [Dehalococcoidia bacterium]|nr:DNA-3-methyladenine glycosylase [Dehalococcoidia bacterium]